MSKITPERLAKDHSELANKTFKMEKLASLEKALGASDESPILSALGALRQLNPGRIPGLRPYATAVYNLLREDWLPEVDLPKLHSEGVIYTGLPKRDGGGVFANLDEGAALVLKDAIVGLGEQGRWELRSDGSIMLTCKPSKAGVEVFEEDGQRIMECRDAAGALRVRMSLGSHPINFASSDDLGTQVHQVAAAEDSAPTPTPYVETTTKKQRLIRAEARIAQLEGDLASTRAQVDSLVASRSAASVPKTKEIAEKHWNSSRSLPPVGCGLVIKLPKGEYPYGGATEGMVRLVITLDEGVEVMATRICHVQQRGNDLTYSIQCDDFPDFTVKGQFEWTYP